VSSKTTVHSPQKKTKLFPSKAPNNFQKCVINAASIGFQPFVSLVRKETEEYSNAVYDIGV
jgi:hypothetical protein